MHQQAHACDVFTAFTFRPMHSSPTLTTPTVPFLVQAGFCATGLALGLLAYHTFSQPAATPQEPLIEARSVRFTVEAPPPLMHRGAEPVATKSAPSATDASATPWGIVASHRSNPQKIAKLAVWADRATEAELKQALAHLGASQDEPESDLVDSIVFARLAEMDGEMALQTFTQFEENGAREFSHDAIEALFESWASWDPQGAARGIFTLLQQNPGRFSAIANSALSTVSQDFPLYARDLASQLARSDDESVREIGYETHADLLRQHLERGNDYASALAWIATTHVSTEERTFLLSALVTQALNADHLADAQAVFRQVDATANPELTMRMIRTLADTNPQASREITLSLPAGELRSEAASVLTRLLLKTDSPANILSWLGAQSTHADFDQAFAQLAEAFDGSDPRAAWACATRVSDDAEKKPNLTYEVSFKWLKADFAQASQELPPELVQKYQRTEVLLREFGEVFPDSNHEFSISFRPAKLRLR